MPARVAFSHWQARVGTAAVAAVHSHWPFLPATALGASRPAPGGSRLRRTSLSFSVARSHSRLSRTRSTPASHPAAAVSPPARPSPAQPAQPSPPVVSLTRPLTRSLINPGGPPSILSPPPPSPSHPVHPAHSLPSLVASHRQGPADRRHRHRARGTTAAARVSWPSSAENCQDSAAIGTCAASAGLRIPGPAQLAASPHRLPRRLLASAPVPRRRRNPTLRRGRPFLAFPLTTPFSQPRVQRVPPV